MDLTNGSQPETPGARNGENGEPSKLQLRMAAGIVDRLIEVNAGREVADAFWDDDSFDMLNDAEPDLEFDDPEQETVPEMDLIWWNIYECD